MSSGKGVSRLPGDGILVLAVLRAPATLDAVDDDADESSMLSGPDKGPLKAGRGRGLCLGLSGGAAAASPVVAGVVVPDLLLLAVAGTIVLLLSTLVVLLTVN